MANRPTNNPQILNPKNEPAVFTGQIDIKDAKGKVFISLGVKQPLQGSKSSFTTSFIDLFNQATGQPMVNLSSLGQFTLAGEGHFILKNIEGDTVLEIKSGERRLTLIGPRGRDFITLDLNTSGGMIEVSQVMKVEGGVMHLGSKSNEKGLAGKLFLSDGKGETNLELNGETGVLHVQRMLKHDQGTLRLGSEPGGNGTDGKLLVRNAQGEETVRIEGKTGDILLLNADCAEDFEVVGAGIEPGTVMVLDDEGRLIPSHTAYDRRVAGVISGAGSYQPALVLDRHPDADNRRPIALIGKVFCKVDAQPYPIAVGDLLTTSNIPGYAMKATDPGLAFGAVLGKALKPMRQAQGLIPVLVALQ